MKIEWFTDIHINFLGDYNKATRQFITTAKGKKPDAILLTGDIAHAESIVIFLTHVSRHLGVPIYYVLGNHDFFGGYISPVRQAVARLEQVESSSLYLKKLKYLSVQSAPLELAPGVCLIGHDGWGDGRYGNYKGTDLEFNDFIRISDLSGLTKEGRLQKLNDLGTEAALHIRRLLTQAVENYSRIILVMHVPPFEELCVSKPRALLDDFPAASSTSNWSPFMACKAVGDVILEIMSPLQHITLEIYCGHTHTAAVYKPLPNVTARVGGAQYGVLESQGVIEI